MGIRTAHHKAHEADMAVHASTIEDHAGTQTSNPYHRDQDTTTATATTLAMAAGEDRRPYEDGGGYGGDRSRRRPASPPGRTSGADTRGAGSAARRSRSRRRGDVAGEAGHVGEDGYGRAARRRRVPCRRPRSLRRRGCRGCGTARRRGGPATGHRPTEASLSTSRRVPSGCVKFVHVRRTRPSGQRNAANAISEDDRHAVAGQHRPRHVPDPRAADRCPGRPEQLRHRRTAPCRCPRAASTSTPAFQYARSSWPAPPVGADVRDLAAVTDVAEQVGRVARRRAVDADALRPLGPVEVAAGHREADARSPTASAAPPPAPGRAAAPGPRTRPGPRTSSTCRPR